MDLKEQFRSYTIEDQIIWVIENARTNEFTFLKWFCELYDPRIIDHPLEVIKDHSVFLSFVFSEATLAYPLEFVLLLRIFCRIDGLEKKICDFRGLYYLCRILRDSVNDKSDSKNEIVKNGCICIGMLATNDEVRKLFKEEGIIILLLDLLKIYKSDIQFVKLICNVLNNACFKEIENKILFIENGGFVLLVHFLGSNIDLPTKQAAALLLRSICNLEQDRNYLIDTVETAIGDVLIVLQQEINNKSPEIHIHLLSTLLNLTRNDSDIKRQVGVKDGCNRILQLMNHFKDNDNIQLLASKVLIQLAKKRYNRMAIGKARGLFILIPILQDQRSSFKLLFIILQLIDILCLQGINRKHITLDEANLTTLINLLKDYMGVRTLVISILEIFLKIASGASQSKLALRSFNALSTFTEVISNYTSDAEVRNLASACTAEVFKVTSVEEEDSNETWSTSSSSGNSDEENSEPPDQMQSVENSYQLLKRTVETERFENLKKENIKQAEMIKQLQEELELEKSAHKATVEELELVKYEREYESSLVEEKELENQQLLHQYHILQQSNTSLHTQTENYQKEIEKLESSMDQRTKEIQETEQRLAHDQINTLKSDLLKKDQIYQQMCHTLQESQQLQQKLLSELEEKTQSIEKSTQTMDHLGAEKLELSEKISYLVKEKEVMESKLEDSVEDSMLFYWMTVAIRLDFLMHDKKGVNYTNFDRQEVYDYLKQNNIPYTAWPRRISSHIHTTKNNK